VRDEGAWLIPWRMPRGFSSSEFAASDAALLERR